MNKHGTANSVFVNLAQISMGFRITPFSWVVTGTMMREQGLACLAVGPFELFCEW
ncbi:hypothetical protein [Kordiimonas sp.]|uniref:hypothetical protein n=1 Tax=Kordiimonas sp. TaxID=1970157 RepID=UPI003B516D30